MSEQSPVKRDAKGRLVVGTGSLNPGGVSKVALELRKEALKSAPKALRIAARMMRSDNPIAQNFGITHILNRALGKDGAAADLPDEEAPLASDLDTSPAGLHTMAARGLARSLLHMEKRAESRVLTPSEIELLSEAAKALATLLKEERELAKQGPGAALSDADLRRQVLASVPLEELQAALAERGK